VVLNLRLTQFNKAFFALPMYIRSEVTAKLQMKCCIIVMTEEEGGGVRLLPVTRDGVICLRLQLCIYVATGHCGADNICADNPFTLKV